MMMSGYSCIAYIELGDIVTFPLATGETCD